MKKLLLVCACVLGSCALASGFLAAVHPETKSNQRQQPPIASFHRLPAAKPEAVTTSANLSSRVDVAAERDPCTSEVKPAHASFSMVLPYPFEQVLEVWEGGPEDPNFIRAEVDERMNGGERLLKKTLYTANPLPWVVKKTVRFSVPSPQPLVPCSRVQMPYLPDSA
jgi:hypothetical protein